MAKNISEKTAATAYAQTPDGPRLKRAAEDLARRIAEILPSGHWDTCSLPPSLVYDILSHIEDGGDLYSLAKIINVTPSSLLALFKDAPLIKEKLKGAIANRNEVVKELVYSQLLGAIKHGPLDIIDLKSGAIKKNPPQAAINAIESIQYHNNGTIKSIKLTSKLKAIEMLSSIVGSTTEKRDEGIKTIIESFATEKDGGTP